MNNSNLVVYTELSPNHSGKRTMEIDRISPHCVVGECSVEELGNWFKKRTTQASSNYGIDTNGRIGMYVEEGNRSWCTSSNSNDQRAVTIECASKAFAPYEMNMVVYETLINLCVDICLRNGKTKLLWLEDKDKTLRYKPAADEMLITVHRWFAKKSCPGDWLYSRLGDLSETVTSRLLRQNTIESDKKTVHQHASTSLTSPESLTEDEVVHQVIAGKWGNGEERKRRLSDAGWDYKIVQSKVNDLLLKK